MEKMKMPCFECRDGIFEIDEFECSEIFLINGTERALVIDTGTGIGELRSIIENKIENKPYDVVLSHNHVDHMGGAAWFEKVYIHRNDMDYLSSIYPPTYEFRKKYAETLRKRENKHYEYTEKDIRPWPIFPSLVSVEDGHIFDLGDRQIKVIHCPGHTKGELVFYDNKTRTLLCGDAFNCNWLMDITLAESLRRCVEISLHNMKKIYSMRSEFEYVVNSHHDYRKFCSPLAPDVMPDLIVCLEKILNGTVQYRIEEDTIESGKEKTVACYKDIVVSCPGGDISKI